MPTGCDMLPNEQPIEDGAERFRIYCEELAYWVPRLGLVGWSVQPLHEQPVGKPNSVAQVHYNLVSRIATTRLNPDIVAPCDRTETALRRDAFHEACHLLLAKLDSMASEYCAEYLVNRELHTVIATLENTLFSQDWEARRRKHLAWEHMNSHEERMKNSFIGVGGKPCSALTD